jgi:flagellin
MYAENNLNNTSNSLNTVLQQLSSGSKINSGADDAAGLSLVDGLQANSMALAQSQTNASEGVGLLKVADGALSQVTNLLNRAVTLATEASNGTLNTSQDAAANSEYQSILSEINNIGTTTTYNNQTVFGAAQPVNIYTGDSSTAGASVDALNIASLSASNVGDSGGVMAYSNGADNVFLNLSSSTTNAAATDQLNSSGTTSLTVNYLVKGGSGASSTATTTITAGGNSGYQNTASGLIDAINNSGLGLTANFSTQAAAGVTGGGTQTGIEISGGLVSAGVAPSSSSTGGTLNASGIPASELLTNGQTVNVSENGTQVATVTVGTTANVSGGGTVNTLTELAASINNQAGAGTASVQTNGDRTQSLVMADKQPNLGAMTVTTSNGSGPVTPVFSNLQPGGATTTLAAYGTAVTGNTYTPPTQGSVTFGVSGTNAGTDTLSAGGSITLTNSATNTALTFVVGTGTNTTTTFFTANNTVAADQGNTLADLAETIHEQAATLGADATVGAGGITVKAATAQTNLNITASQNTLTNANATIGLYNPTDGGAAVTGTDTVTALDAGATTASTDTLNTGGVITLSNGNTADNFTYVAVAGQKISDLMTAISASTLGVTATFSGNAILLTSGTHGANPITVVGTNTLTDTAVAGSPSLLVDPANAGTVVGTGDTAATHATAVLQLTNGGTITDASDQLTGQIELKNGGAATQTIIMGAGTSSGTTYYTGGNTLNSLINTIDGIAALGMTAVAGGNGVGSKGSIYLQSTATATAITNPGGAANTLADAVSLTAAAPVSGVTTVAGQDSTLSVGTASNNLSTTDTLAAGGSIVLANSANSSLAANQYTFTVGTGATTQTVGNVTTLAAGSTLTDLATAISGISALGVTATATTGGLSLVSSNFDANQIKVIGTSTMADATTGGFSQDTLGSFANANDTISGTLSFSAAGTAQSITLQAGETVQGLANYIHANKSTLGVDAKVVDLANGAVNIQLTSTTEGASGAISATSNTSITDTATTASLNYTAAGGYNTGISGTVGDQTTAQTSASFVSNTSGGKGVATISYSDGAGQSLSATDLTNSTDAKAALTALNAAITDVASQDGYIGAQINTLNSVSSVLSTQQQNVTAAQNAVQATDYASAASNMSKYEILSQTGISALAQANSMQQEVTKLLQ